MNELNYASLEASKKLHEAGIVLETDALWSLFLDGFHLIMKTELHPLVENYPAPSMAEVLRELPNNTAILKNRVYYTLFFLEYLLSFLLTLSLYFIILLSINYKLLIHNKLLLQFFLHSIILFLSLK